MMKGAFISARTCSISLLHGVNIKIKVKIRSKLLQNFWCSFLCLFSNILTVSTGSQKNKEIREIHLDGLIELMVVL
jgi:hypothetical protein